MAFNTKNIHTSKEKLFSRHVYCCSDHLYLSIGSGNAFLSEGFVPQNTNHSLHNTVRSELTRRGPVSVCGSLLLYKVCYCVFLFRAHSGRCWNQGAWPCLSVWGLPLIRRSCAGWASSRRAGGDTHPKCRRRQSSVRGSGTDPSAVVKECIRTRGPLHIRTSSVGCLKHTRRARYEQSSPHATTYEYMRLGLRGREFCFNRVKRVAN